MIEDRNLAAGTKLVARYKGKEYGCEVVSHTATVPDGKGDADIVEVIRYRVDGQDFKSPSSAGSHVMGGIACNGWRFWSVEGQESEPKAKTKEAKGADFRRIPGGRAWCNGCSAAFKIEAGTTPTVCPRGHTPGDATDEPEKEAVTA